MIKSNLCDYSDAYIHVKGPITVPNTTAQGVNLNNMNKKVTFKNYASFINCISEVDNTQVDDAHDIDVVMPMYSLIEYSVTYSKTSGCLWQFYKDNQLQAMIIDFLVDKNKSVSFKFNQQITGQTGNNGTKDVEIMVPLEYLSNFWGTIEMLLRIQ